MTEVGDLGQGGVFTAEGAEGGSNGELGIGKSGIRRGLLLRSTGKGGFETRPYGYGVASDTYTAMLDWVSPAARASM